MAETHSETECAQASMAEREAVERVLRSPIFRRAPKLSRIFSYICDEYFRGEAGRIKEYNIAVEALGRPGSFDPQMDAIVRVDLHLLRRRLKAYYTGAGAAEKIRIVLRSGCYAPEFVRVETPALPAAEAEEPEEDIREVPEYARGPEPAARPSRKTLTIGLALLAGALIGLLAGFLVAADWLARRTAWVLFTPDRPQPAQMATASFLEKLDFRTAPDTLLDGIRIGCGSKADLVDSDGLKWKSDRYFTGGLGFQRYVSTIYRSADPALYCSGRQGVFHYDIPARPGLYEVHLMFAETQPGVEDGTRAVSYVVGAGQAERIDILSDTGAADTAAERVYANVRPGADGKIHLKFLSADSLLNAIEVLPQRSSKPGPVRISALANMYTDLGGGHWLSDRYFLGGMNVPHQFSHNPPDPPLFSRERYGTFDYAIPVAKGYQYTVTLYMTESYWGARNSGTGGAGTRLFTVRCNGLTLLASFDLAAAQRNNAGVVVRFRHLRPDTRGRLDFQFAPVKNYALINAIALDAE